MRARAFQVYERVRSNTLYHEEQGRFLPEVAPQVEMWMREKPKETSQESSFAESASIRWETNALQLQVAGL